MAEVTPAASRGLYVTLDGCLCAVVLTPHAAVVFAPGVHADDEIPAEGVAGRVFPRRRFSAWEDCHLARPYDRAEVDAEWASAGLLAAPAAGA